MTATVFNSDHLTGVAATLPVNVLPLASPVLTAPRFSQQAISLQFTGQAGLTYDLQQATNLASPISWQTLQTVKSVGGVITVTNLQVTGQYLFYRVQSRERGRRKFGSIDTSSQRLPSRARISRRASTSSLSFSRHESCLRKMRSAGER